VDYHTSETCIHGWSKGLCRDCRSGLLESADLVSHRSIIDALAAGERFEEPWLIKGDKHLQKHRDPNKKRFPIGHPLAGFPLEFPDLMRGTAPAGCHWAAFGDCETLEWVVVACLDKPEPGLGFLPPSYLYVPTVCGNVRAIWESRHLRALLGWSQNVLDARVQELPGLLKKIGSKDEVTVEALVFLAALSTGDFPRLAPRNIIRATISEHLG